MAPVTIIRTAQLNDIPAIQNIVTALSPVYLQHIQTELPHWFSATLTDEAFHRRLAGNTFHNYVYVEGEKIAGYIAMNGDSHLYHLFVDVAQQGKGIARKLWQFVINKHQSEVYTVRSSINAIPVYKRFGFVESDAVSQKDGLHFQAMTLKLQTKEGH